jgi:hypothetical protein
MVHMKVHIVEHAPLSRQVPVALAGLVVDRRAGYILAHCGITTEPPSRPAVQVAGAVVIEAGFAVALLSGRVAPFPSI